eukprot:CAMPEP_0183575446 /NCGR_PEP_ID=MMETSP0371-20130417/135611_1 /TAXON_ID=268820 /ORGANISM="Peridinium aciculiferum, Strain PAER-2" /LENGTH=160 /DNA_ID=CAMNT_0025785611 /DNA_START=26 /DNA_END=504 /DNA_ORIENTATION=-
MSMKATFAVASPPPAAAAKAPWWPAVDLGGDHKASNSPPMPSSKGPLRTGECGATSSLAKCSIATLAGGGKAKPDADSQRAPVVVRGVRGAEAPAEAATAEAATTALPARPRPVATAETDGADADTARRLALDFAAAGVDGRERMPRAAVASGGLRPTEA